MRCVFRVDASLQIGTGHVMRCLTLADYLSTRGANCHFICRPHHGNLNKLISSRGHALYEISGGEPAYEVVQDFESTKNTKNTQLNHRNWLGSTQLEDAEACVHLMSSLTPDLLVVDHYALDEQWEKRLKPYCKTLVAIDDLADRSHISDVLIDQTFGRKSKDYAYLVPENCILLCGSTYAMLRPQFSALRSFSLQRRKNPVIKKILVSMGGFDQDNFTLLVLKSLKSCPLPDDLEITVVMGSQAPWLESVSTYALSMPRKIRILSGVDNIAEEMARSDLAIGAAGVTALERCCLGLPAIIVVLAQNQLNFARALAHGNCAKLIGQGLDISRQLKELISPLILDPNNLKSLSEASARVTNGSGVIEVVNHLEQALA